MKYFLLMLVLILVAVERQFAQDVEDLKSRIAWKKVILKNYATFKNRKDLDGGSAFLIKYNTGIIACTARDFTGTTYTPGGMLLIKDFDRELLWWKMYLPDDPSKYILMDTLALKDRIERSYSIFFLFKTIFNICPEKYIQAYDPFRTGYQEDSKQGYRFFSWV